jgi:hypothetical protein
MDVKTISMLTTLYDHMTKTDLLMLSLSATGVDASATMHAPSPTLHYLHKTITPPTHGHPTMKTPLPNINKVLTL